MNIFTSAERKTLENLGQKLFIFQTIFIPFVTPLLLFATWGKETKHVNIYYLYTIFIFLTFYLSSYYVSFDIGILFYCIILITTPFYLSKFNSMRELSIDFTYGFVILLTLYNGISIFLSLTGMQYRTGGLHLNAFNAAYIFTLFTLITIYHKQLTKYVSWLIGLSIGLSLTRTALFLLPFIPKNRIFHWLIGITFALLFSYLFAPDLVKARFNIATSASERIEITTVESNPELLTGLGLGNPETEQLPHNLYLALTTQIGIIPTILLSIIFVLILIYWGYQNGIFKTIPIFLYTLIDPSLGYDHMVLAATIIYLFMMRREHDNA